MGWWTSNQESAPPKATTPTETAATSDTSQSVTPPAPSQQPPRSPSPVQKVDRLLENFTEGHSADSTESSLRYAAYTNRIRTILSSAHRYVAYTSEVGESFRPVAHPKLVRAAYGVSWAYIVGDVSYEGYKAYLENRKVLYPSAESNLWRDGTAKHGAFSNELGWAAPRTVPLLEDYRTVIVQRFIFQSLASMGLPALTIHSVVKYSGKAMKNVKNVRLRTWGPVGLGLGVVPFLPIVFDKPVENAVELIFHEAFLWVGGRDYVGNAPTTGRERVLGKVLDEKKEP